MKKEISYGLKASRGFAIAILVLGVVLMAYMITVESEPGALPLLFVLVGIVWLLVNRYQVKKYRQ